MLVAEDGSVAVELMKRQRIDILITDIRMPQMSGVDVLREAKRIDPEIITIMMTARIHRYRSGGAPPCAADYVHKSPAAVNELHVVRKIEQAPAAGKPAAEARAPDVAICVSRTSSAAAGPMLAIFQLIETIAPTSSTVLVSGESGTAEKSLVARDPLHLLRKDRPFVAVNCGALSETLLDSAIRN